MTVQNDSVKNDSSKFQFKSFNAFLTKFIMGSFICNQMQNTSKVDNHNKELHFNDKPILD